MKRVLFIAIALLLPAVTACASTAFSGSASRVAPSAAGTQQLTVKAMDTMRFDPARLNARAGQSIQLTLENTGHIVHDFHITEGVSQPVTAKAQAGEKATATFSVTMPGTYTFVCGEPGHEQAGMKGTLNVQ